MNENPPAETKPFSWSISFKCRGITQILRIEDMFEQ